MDKQQEILNKRLELFSELLNAINEIHHGPQSKQEKYEQISFFLGEMVRVGLGLVDQKHTKKGETNATQLPTDT